MNRLLPCFLLLGISLFVIADAKSNRANVPKYSTKYDNVDIDAILSNDRVLKNYIDCCLGKKRCTPDGLELRSHIRDAMDHNCDKCSDAQKKGIRKICLKLYKDKPEWWKELCDHFDPDGKNKAKYQKLIDDMLAGKEFQNAS